MEKKFEKIKKMEENWSKLRKWRQIGENRKNAKIEEE